MRIYYFLKLERQTKHAKDPAPGQGDKLLLALLSPALCKHRGSMNRNTHFAFLFTGI